MNTAAFRKGALVVINKKTYTLLRQLETHEWQLEERTTGRIVLHADLKLRELYTTQRLAFKVSTDEHPTVVTREIPADLPPRLWEAAKVKRAYVVATLNLPGTRTTLTPVIHETWKKLGSVDTAPHVATVLRWRSNFLKSGKNILSLIARHDRKGNFEPRYPAEVRAIVDDAIERKYMTKERGTIQDVIDVAQATVITENKLRPMPLALPRPARRFVQRMIRTIPAFDRHAARHGRQSALRRFRSVQNHLVATAALDTAIFDHTQMDLMVVDEDTCLPLGRPWLTVCLDDATRMCLGIFISFEPPSYHSVARCLRHAIMPKSSLKTDYPEIVNSWDAHGLMRRILVDNGPEFHSVSLENACYVLNIEIHYSPCKTPWFKGKIERFLGTMNRGISGGVAGTTFSNIFEKEDYDPARHAVVGLKTLHTIAAKWVVDVYHQKSHRTLGAPPALVWKNTVNPSDVLLPSDPTRFDAILGQSITRRLTHKGIELNSLFYNSHGLVDLRRQYGAELDVQVRLDTANLGQITVFSPDGQTMLTVPALDAKYAVGLSAWQHRICKRHAARLKLDQSSDGWLLAKKDISQLINEDFVRKSRKTRSRIARFQNDASLVEKIPRDESNPEDIGASSETATRPHTEIDSFAEPRDSLRNRRSYKPVIRDRMGSV